MLDRFQKCPDCGRDYAGEEGDDVRPGACCPASECPSNEVAEGTARAGMVCEDCDGSFVKLDRPHGPHVWECASWTGSHWSYEGDRIHLGNLRRVPNPTPAMTA